jgi:hypothetical protein
MLQVAAAAVTVITAFVGAASVVNAVRVNKETHEPDHDRASRIATTPAPR